MTNTLTKFAIVAVLIFLHLNAAATDRDSIELLVRIPKMVVTNAKDLILEIQIKSYKQEPLLFFKDPPPGFVKRKMGAFRIQLQSSVDTQYVDFPIHGTADNLPVPEDTIKCGQSRSYKFSISLFYPQLPKGNYRVRLLAAFSLQNPRVNDKFSKWVYFTCGNNINAWAEK